MSSASFAFLRGLDEANAMDEIEIAENGPSEFKAEKFLRGPWIANGKMKLNRDIGTSLDIPHKTW